MIWPTPVFANSVNCSSQTCFKSSYGPKLLSGIRSALDPILVVILSKLHTYLLVTRLALWFLKRNSRYGLRAIIIGEAANPGPQSPRDLSRTPPRVHKTAPSQANVEPMPCDTILPDSLFRDASSCLGVLCTCSVLASLLVRSARCDKWHFPKS